MNNKILELSEWKMILRAAKYFGGVIFLALICLSCDKDISTTPPDPEPGSGKIIINSNPEGYDIYLNDRMTGKRTPDSIIYLDNNNYNISLKHELYLDTNLTVSVDNGVEEVGIDLTARDNFYSRLECISNPAQAEIIFDDSSTGIYTPAILSGIYPGKHSISVVKLGFRSREFEIMFKSDLTSSISFSLEDTTEWLIYNTDNSDLVANSLSSIGYNPNVSNEMWIGTDEEGVMDISSADWINYNTNNSILPMNFISFITIGEFNKHVIGTMNGLVEINNGTWSLITSDNTNIPSHVATSAGYSPPGTTRNEEFIFGTDEGLIRFSNDTWDEVAFINERLPSRDITSVDYSTNFGSFRWIVGTRDAGLFIYNTYTNIGPTAFNSSNAGFISNNITTVSVVDGTHETYVGVKISSGIGDAIGMLYFHENNETWREINLDFAIINDIIVDFQNTWVATNNGLYKLNNRTMIAEHFTTENSPLPSNNVYDMILDRSVNLWMATGRGLVRFQIN